MATIGILGTGTVGEVLADGFLKHGHEVMRGSRDAGEARRRGSSGRGRQGAASGDVRRRRERSRDVVVLAVKGTAAEDGDRARAAPTARRARSVHRRDEPDRRRPADGRRARSSSPARTSRSWSACSSRRPTARFVKAFSCVGNALHGRARTSRRPAADDVHLRQRRRGQGARSRAHPRPASAGTPRTWAASTAARAIEPLCMLWCIPGFLRNQWTHAFRLLRA
ncbi:MAG: NAD(P)-binding domain-containing protein [Ottowia sp.]